MKIEVRVEATPNERRRLLGQADIIPMIELVSEMLDDVMMVVVEARLDALEAFERRTETDVVSPEDASSFGMRQAGG